MEKTARFAEAMKRIDAANAVDPRTELVAGQPRPKELLFAERVYDWVFKLVDEPSEVLQLAARAHTLRRWVIPRDRYPKTKIGYHQWRDTLAQFHADEAESILAEVGYATPVIEAVRSLITKANWPKNPEAQALEDADCLVFLENKLFGYVDEWGEAKTLRILTKTCRKMTREGRALAGQLHLGDRERELLQRATRSVHARQNLDQ